MNIEFHEKFQLSSSSLIQKRPIDYGYGECDWVSKCGKCPGYLTEAFELWMPIFEDEGLFSK